MENVGTAKVTVMRVGKNLQHIVTVDYRTEGGTATPGSDYEHTQGQYKHTEITIKNMYKKLRVWSMNHPSSP